MKLTWHGHSCVSLESTQGTVVIDPYQDGSVPGFPPLHLKGNLVLCSHEHRDHNARECVQLSGNTLNFSIQRLSSGHDDQQGARRGTNTIHILTLDGMRVAHVGDLGCMPSPEQLEQLQNLDALLLPVGGYYTINAAQAAQLADQLRPRVVVPMHYRGQGFGYDVLTTLDEFLALRSDIVRYPGSSLTLTPDTTPQTAVLTLSL